MRIDLPCCGFKNCRHCFDGNCTKPSEQGKCEYWYLLHEEPENEIPRRVLWSGWKGYRDTRYKCPNCEKPVRNDDAYCHRCGQRLMFPKISFTDYVPGEKQDVIVRWDDEE